MTSMNAKPVENEKPQIPFLFPKEWFACHLGAPQKLDCNHCSLRPQPPPSPNSPRQTAIEPARLARIVRSLPHRSKDFLPAIQKQC